MLRVRHTLVVFMHALVCVALVGAANASGQDIKGTAKDASGGAIAGARIAVLTPAQTVVATTTTDPGGAFTITNLPNGEYVVVAQYPSLAEQRAAVRVSRGAAAGVALVLGVVPFSESVSVTAQPGAVTDLASSTQPVNVIGEDEILTRAKTVVAQIVDGEPGVHLQRTGPGMAGISVRGLTGNKVNIYVDGVRYSNGAQRGGVNTFLDLIDPAALARAEVLRGTSSAEYGSDALGGSVQFLTHVPSLSATGGPKLTGSVSLGAETAHAGGFGAGTLSYARGRFGLLGTLSYRKTGDYRPGGGEDTHAAVTRFFGLPSSRFLGDRMPDTGFTQRGGHVRANWAAGSRTLLTASYMSSRQNDANRWDQILGGDGNMIAELNDLQLDLGYVRVERLGAGVFDRASLTYSIDTQREERVNQGGQGDATASIVHQPERTTVNGVQFNASRQVSSRQSVRIGADVYLERHSSDSFDVNPATSASVKSRPRVPNGATFSQSGVFAQTSLNLSSKAVVTGAVRAGFTSYEARAADAPLVNGRPMWPDDSLSTTSVTGKLGATIAPTPAWQITGAVSTGYRAPHMTDLGTLGLTGSGFEVAAPDVAGLGGSVGTTADATAVSTGKPVEQVGSETNVNVDVGTRVQWKRLNASVGGFVNTIDGNIQKPALILPAGAVGTELGGTPITSQNANGAVFVALSAVPVLVRANFDRARITGFETEGDIRATSQVSLGWTYTRMTAEDLDTRRPPDIEGGTPAAGGTVWVRYMPKAGTWWAQPYVWFAGRQSRLSSLDAGDRRTGATRTRGQIQNFFHRGARNRGWIEAGPDGISGSADDRLIETGETLPQIQDRVLGVGVASSPLWSVVPAYTLVGIRFGVRFGPNTITIDAENLGDQSYRGISWGMDGPGRGVSVRYSVAFK